ncbi:Holliday junction resolvase RuvX [Kangiella koreensis]|uniref:Putative pre-16S rRNA nuclease n=1 Tax=Kangiella koreensis (strain DSM 16069 / JCM 12317 / KCTC 12182 / SW-125) TaxID=523791 RepID=C7R793_KANKD|nr:Holliday junction resolvase RuvX [Kangiella koreensis]ACV25642.1 Holliday junction resolvase YqgF [Kangiella koreensis DSM 16069]
MTTLTTAQRYLCFDFGEKRLGVATGVRTQMSSQALTVLAVTNDQPDWKLIENLIREWNVEAFVVGLPLNMDDSEQELTQKARKFANRLHGRFGLPTHLHDERLSSAEVKDYLYEIGGYKKLKQNPIDAYAAELILKSFFEQHQTS